ncbi:cilia- and flagella-associated protein 69-like [Pseudorasbora parva]|uniref:cilia- and flagella-associated protein 69-like n=1 Tax=Pseudorasbora parva TaxID=51549 RepID=UPI00351E9FEF
MRMCLLRNIIVKLGHLLDNNGWRSAETLKEVTGLRSLRLAAKLMEDIFNVIPSSYREIIARKEKDESWFPKIKIAPTSKEDLEGADACSILSFEVPQIELFESISKKAIYHTTVKLSLSDVKQPLVSRPQDGVRAVVRDVSEDLRANVYAIFCKLGFERLLGLSAEDLVTLSIIRRYLDFKVAEALFEVSAELGNEGATPVSSDEEALKSLCQLSEDKAQNLRSLQQSILGRQQQDQLKDERRMYEEILFTQKQREMAAKAWRNYMARTSNYSILKEFKRRQEEQRPSEPGLEEPETQDGLSDQ